MGRPGGADRRVPFPSRLDSGLIARVVEPAGGCVAQRAAVWALSARLGSRGSLHEEWSWWKRLGSAVSRPERDHDYLPPLSAHRSRTDDRTDRRRAVHLPVARGAPVLARRGDDRAQRARPLVCRAHRFALAGSERAIRVAGPRARGDARRWAPASSPHVSCPLLFGIATLAVALWIGRRWMGPAGATALMLLCSISQWFSHYPFEVKHYTSDVFWALLLPALAVWASKPTPRGGRVARPSGGWRPRPDSGCRMARCWSRRRARCFCSPPGGAERAAARHSRWPSADVSGSRPSALTTSCPGGPPSTIRTSSGIGRRNFPLPASG